MEKYEFICCSTRIIELLYRLALCSVGFQRGEGGERGGDDITIANSIYFLRSISPIWLIVVLALRNPSWNVVVREALIIIIVPPTN